MCYLHSSHYVLDFPHIQHNTHYYTKQCPVQSLVLISNNINFISSVKETKNNLPTPWTEMPLELKTQNASYW